MEFITPTRRQSSPRTLVWAVATTIVLAVHCFNAQTTIHALSTKPVVRAIPFQEFKYAPNSVCISPQYFVAPRENDKTSNSTEMSYFTMRNVPGDGDCMFLAVALAAATSMGLGGSNELLQAISRQTRHIVAQVLSAPTGKLCIGKDNVVDASRLLRSAVLQEPSINTTEEYLEALRKEGRNGGLYGGGPELVALSNVLRRPISIYEVDEERWKEEQQKRQNGDYPNGATNGDSGNETSPAIYFPIVCKGSFGEGVFEDPCLTSIPDSVILSNMQPGAYSWRLHILVLNSSPTEKHACVLLPQRIYK